jgi:2'-5' RNA ligase
MTGVVSTVTPFTIRTSGLGIFTGLRSVVFIALVKNAALMSFHKMLWDLTRPFSSELNPLYSPEYWMPHISLVYEDTNTINIAGLMQKLAFQPFVWEMSIDNLALIFQENGKAGKVKYQYNFSICKRAFKYET